MLEARQSLVVVEVLFLVIVFLSACVYSITVLLVKRFHTSINLLTVNVCVCSMTCSVYWIVYNVIQGVLLRDLTGWNCVLAQYFQTFANCQAVYGLCVVSVNRFCIVLYNNKLLFKTRRWVFICIGIQWLLGVLIPLPTLSISTQVIVLFLKEK
jgi:hypothetical protein